MRAWFAIVSLFIVGCSTGPDRDEAFLAAKARWAAQNVSSYEIVVRRSCFCATTDPVKVTVVNGQVTARVFTTDGQPVPANLIAYYPDVPGLFDLVEDGYDRAASINVTFDAEYGFPASTVIDYIANAVDDEVAISATGFVKQ